jgi:hypothetical protein
MAYVYKHIRKDTKEVFYIGIGVRLNRLYSKHSRNNLWKNIVERVGFEYEIIDSNMTWELACELEKKLIKYYGRRDLNEGSLVNMTDGGDGVINRKGWIHSEETKLKISKSNKGRKATDESIKINSESHKGLKQSEETKLKRSKKLKGIPRSEDVKRKIGISNKGRVMSEEQKRKISETLKNKNRL